MPTLKPVCLLRDLWARSTLVLMIAAWPAVASTQAFSSPPLDLDAEAALSATPLETKPVTSASRTSPFNPSTTNDHTFVTDSAPRLDTGCIYSSAGPIEFDIKVTRHVGALNSDGTLRDAKALVDAGLLSPKATLVIPAFDVDSDAIPPPPYLPERDRVLFNGEEIGFLTGANNAWKMSTFQIDIGKVKFAAAGTSGQSPNGAANRVTIQIDAANYPTQVWCTSIDWGELQFKAMSPIILVHGNNSNGAFFGHQGFIADLERQHLLFDNSINLPTDLVVNNGSALGAHIPAIVKSYGVDSVHIVAHSKGGLDSREYLARHQPSHDNEFKVLSYTTLSTPHDGSILADLLLARDAAALVAAETEFQGFPTFAKDVLSHATTDIGTTNLTTAFTAGFNAVNLSLIPGSIVFNTVAADADTNANAVIDRDPDEYAELRAESPALRTLDSEFLGQRKTRIAVDVPYQTLRNTLSIGMRTETRGRFLGGTRTVAIVTAHPRTEPVGNDVLVTIPSGQGTSSVQGRTTNTHVFDGPNGRNHSNVADGRVAAQVIPWIIGVEKISGDLQ